LAPFKTAMWTVKNSLRVSEQLRYSECSKLHLCMFERSRSTPNSKLHMTRLFIYIVRLENWNWLM